MCAQDREMYPEIEQLLLGTPPTHPLLGHFRPKEYKYVTELSISAGEHLFGARTPLQESWLCPQHDTVAKWLKHLTVEQKYQVQIPPVASQVKCFLHPPTHWKISLWLKGPGGKKSKVSSTLLSEK